MPQMSDPLSNSRLTSEVEHNQIENSNFLKSVLLILLPAGKSIIIDESRRLLIVFGEDGESPLIAQASRNAWSILLTLALSFPHYSSHESLLASVTMLSVEQCRHQLQRALLEGGREMWRQEFRPAERALAGLRRSLRPLGIEVSVVQQMGYALCSSV